MVENCNGTVLSSQSASKSATLLEASKCIKAESPIIRVAAIHCNNSERIDDLKSPSQQLDTSNKSITVRLF